MFTTHLAGVDVAAQAVHVGVVLEDERVRGALGLGNGDAVVSALHDVGVRAVLAGDT